MLDEWLCLYSPIGWSVVAGTFLGHTFIEKSLTIFDDQDGSLAVGTTSIPADDRADIGNQREVNYGGSHFRGNISVLGDTSGSTIFVSGLHNDDVNTLKYVQTQISENHTS